MRELGYVDRSSAREILSSNLGGGIIFHHNNSYKVLFFCLNMGRRGKHEFVLSEKIGKNIQYMFFIDGRTKADISRELEIPISQVRKVIDLKLYGCEDSAKLSLIYLQGRGFDSRSQYNQFLKLKKNYDRKLSEINGKLKRHGYPIKANPNKRGALVIKFFKKDQKDEEEFVINVFRECLDNVVNQTDLSIEGDFEIFYNKNIDPRLRIKPTGLEARAFLSAYGDVLKG